MMNSPRSTQNQQSRGALLQSSDFLVANLQGTPLEDRLLNLPQRGVFMVVDGVSRTKDRGVYPDPSPAALAAECLVAAIDNALLVGSELPARQRLESAVRAGNAAVAELNVRLFGRTIDYLVRDLAGAVGVIAIQDGSKLQVAYIGDSRLYLIKDNAVTRVTEVQTAKLAQSRIPGVVRPEADVARIRREVRNNPREPLAYGVFTGEPQALAFVRFLTVELAEVDAVLLATDGVAHLEDPVSGADCSLDPATPIPVAAILASPDLRAIADLAHRTADDPGKRTDDIAMIRIGRGSVLPPL